MGQNTSTDLPAPKSRTAVFFLPKQVDKPIFKWMLLIIGIFLVLNTLLPYLAFRGEDGKTLVYWFLSFFKMEQYNMPEQMSRIVGTSLMLKNAIYIVGLYLSILFLSGLTLIAFSFKKLEGARPIGVPIVAILLVAVHLAFCVFTGSGVDKPGFLVEGPGQFLGFTLLNFLAILSLVVAIMGNNLKAMHPDSRFARWLSGFFGLVFLVLIVWDTLYVFKKTEFLSSAWMSDQYALFYIIGSIAFAAMLLIPGARAMLNLASHPKIRKFSGSLQKITVWVAIAYGIYLFVLTTLLVYSWSEEFSPYFITMSLLTLRAMLISVSIFILAGMAIAYRLNVHFKYLTALRKHK